MFWTANFVGPNELNVNSLLKEENLKLTQLLDADDILQECRSDNKALVEYLTKPEILAELITLITQEPPKDVELTLQYRYANMACEVLTSQMSALSVRILADTALINRLCDFVEQEPPLNPLLASYFSKTIENLLDKSPQQDWCLHRIVCLQAVEALRARRRFLPALLRHLATSAVPDVFRVFIRMKENVVVEWLKEHRFLESLIQIICGTYEPDEPSAPPTPPTPPPQPRAPPGAPALNNHQGEADSIDTEKEESNDGILQSRLRAVAASNAAALLCDVIRTGCVKDVSDYYRSGTAGWLRGRLAGAADEILRCVFSSPGDRRAQALLGAGDILLELLAAEGELEAARGGVELALAPHLPLLHQELLREPPPPSAPNEYGGPRAVVGAARLQVAALLARLAASAVPEVPSTIITLGTCGVLVDMFFRFSANNFLHERVLALAAAAARNPPYADTFLRHFVEECDLLTRLMDKFEDIEQLKGTGKPRPGHAGHVTRLLALLADVLPPGAPPAWLATPLLQRWAAFVQGQLAPRLTLLDTPLLEEPAEACADLDLDHMMVAMTQFLSGSYYIDDGCVGQDNSADLDELFSPSGDDLDDDDKDPWEASAAPAPAPVSAEGWASFDDAFGDPFANANEQGNAREHTGEHTGQHTSEQSGEHKLDAFATSASEPSDMQDDFSPFWSYKGCEGGEGEGGGDANAADLQSALEGLRVNDASAASHDHDAQHAQQAHHAHATSEASAASLTNNLLTAISGISPDMLAEYVKVCTTILPLDELLKNRGYAQKIPQVNAIVSESESPPRDDATPLGSHSVPSVSNSNELESSEAQESSDSAKGATTCEEAVTAVETASGEKATTTEKITTVEKATTVEKVPTVEGAVMEDIAATVTGEGVATTGEGAAETGAR